MYGRKIPFFAEDMKNRKGKGGKYLEKENTCPSEERKQRKKIFGQKKKRRTGKDKEEDKIEKDSAEGQTYRRTELIFSCRLH